MEPVSIILMYFVAIYGIMTGEWILVAVSILVVFFMTREFTVPFILSVGIIYGTFLLLGSDKATWGAVSVAIAAITMVIAGVLGERKKKEEIPPEMIPYLMALYGGGYGGR